MLVYNVAGAFGTALCLPSASPYHCPVSLWEKTSSADLNIVPLFCYVAAAHKFRNIQVRAHTPHECQSADKRRIDNNNNKISYKKHALAPIPQKMLYIFIYTRVRSHHAMVNGIGTLFASFPLRAKYIFIYSIYIWTIGS